MKVISKLELIITKISAVFVSVSSKDKTHFFFFSVFVHYAAAAIAAWNSLPDSLKGTALSLSCF